MPKGLADATAVNQKEMRLSHEAPAPRHKFLAVLQL